MASPWISPFCLGRCKRTTIACSVVVTLLLLNVYVFLTPMIQKEMMTKHSLLDVTPADNTSVKVVKHLVFLKVHKAASTTVLNIVVRFGLSNNLTFMTPRRFNIISEKHIFQDKNILPSVQNGTYDILCNHMIFNKTIISRYFPSDTKYFTILRDPFSQMVSAFMYYKFVYPQKYLLRIAGKDPITTYLKNPLKYEPKKLLSSFTFNRMSIDLGFDPTYLVNVSSSRATMFLHQLEQNFDLVLIMEYFDESIVLLRRMLGWNIKDILYVSANSFQNTSFRFSPEDRSRHQRWAWLDNAVYSHFYKVFWRKVSQQGPQFFDEVHTFQSLCRLVQAFCSQKVNGTDIFQVKKSKWNPEFEITASDCSLMTMHELPLMDVVRMYHLKRMKDYGIKEG